MGYNPSPPAVNKRPIKPPPGGGKMTNPMSGERKIGPLKITTKRDGTTYDLEEVFDIVLDLADNDPSKALNRIIDMFEASDSGIRKKVKVLASMLARKYPDKYDYKPDPDEDPDRDLRKYKSEVKKNQVKQGLMYVIASIIIMAFVGLGLTFFAMTLIKDEKTKPVAPIEQPLNQGETREL